MPFDILSMVKPDESRQAREEKNPEDNRRRWFEIEPSTVYPATLVRLQEVAEGDEAMELFSTLESADVVRRMTQEAKKLSEEDFELANTPRGSCDDAVLERRSVVLELARKWFTRALRVAAEEPIGVHILRDKDWKLC